jgi:hypothetical protein
MWCLSTPNRAHRTHGWDIFFSAATVRSAVWIFVLLAWAVPASAQSVARFSLESVVAADEFDGENVSGRPQIVIDVSMAIRIGGGWQAYARPWFRLPRPATAAAPVPAWDTQIYQMGLRYEHHSHLSTRIDLGYILSPIGLGVFDTRPGINPTIVPHLSYLAPMPAFDPTGPRVSAVSATYPLGAQVSLSTTIWDARAAVINSAPTRAYVLGAVTNPRQTPVVVAGAGVTPMIGLRLGASVAHGVYATPDEIRTPVSRGRVMTMVGGEGDWAFGGTKITGEILRTSFETIGARANAYEWFVQGTHTLSPRWFVAARREGTSAPPLINGFAIGSRTEFAAVEATAGFRVSPDVTLRASYHTRRLFGVSTWANQVGGSIVWAPRWW